MKRHYFIYPLLAWMAMFLLPSCVREDLLHDEENVIPGLETTISLKINVPDMDIATRADMAPGTDSKLNSLWVGIFSATSGKCTYAKMYTTDLPQNEHGNFVELNDIKTKSGPSYIVAVGNPEGNYGYQYDPASSDSVEGKSLSELLPDEPDETTVAAFTWETYKNIAISRRSMGNAVDDPSGNLPMSGVYYKVDKDPTPEDWEDANETPVMIPAADSYKLSGAVHLRRLISHVKFNISAAVFQNVTDLEENPNKNGKTIVSVVPQRYQVVNAPFTSWLHERKTQVGKDPVTNSGDVISIQFDGKNYGGDNGESLYRSSPFFRGSQSISSNEDGSYSIDFWMLENKRWALKSINYDEREKERKGESGSINADLNTGIYTALCGETGEPTMNNMATFVVIWCKVKYTEPGMEALHNDSNYGDVIERTADAYYTIHLGGVNDDWSDFAHRRNHQYTYNVKVVDVDRIIVEAKGKDETRPGIEGVVSDIRRTYDLDAHYGVFNIALSNKERTGGSGLDAYPNGLCPFRLEVFYNDERIIIDQNNFREFSKADNTKKSAKLWQWIEFRPTQPPIGEGENQTQILARYLPYESEPKNDDTNKSKTFRLDQIANIQDYPGLGKNASDPDDSEKRWYTVFVNEYVYEDGSNNNVYDETANNWVNYVNQPPRTCWINISGNTVSSDKESIYLKSEFIITQKSIQTFYDIPNVDTNNPDVNAIGLEYTDETYGYTLRWTNRDNYLWSGAGGTGDDGNDFSMINGKSNQMRYLRNTNGRTANTNTINWNKYITQERLQKIEGINESSFQYYNLSDHAGLKNGQIYYVPANVYYSYTNNNGFNPNTKWAVAVMDACMNRNRDNNGDGKIDREEIRWYLPSSGEMVDLVNGRNSMEMPFMDYGSNPNLNTPPGDYTNPHHVNTRFHYFSSNRRLLWAEEGITINSVSDNENEWNRMGWHVRCTRALGTDLREREVDLTTAFDVDNTENPTKIRPTYFDDQTLREPQHTALPPHPETSKLNRISTTGFEFKKELLNVNAYNYIYNYTNANNLKNRNLHDEFINKGNQLCANRYNTGKETGWRMPNIKEAAVIKLALNNAGINHPLDPTRDGSKYGQNDERIYSYPNYSSHYGYQVGNFYASTYREYGTKDEERGEKDPTGYYLGIVYEKGNEGGLGRAQCITEERYGNASGDGNCQIYYYIRCVRDL